MKNLSRRETLFKGLALLFGVSSIPSTALASDHEWGNPSITDSRWNAETLEPLVNKVESPIHREYPLSIDESKYREYKRRVDETIETSRRDRSYALIVDKFNYSLDLFKDGKLIKTYAIELGFNPIDDKTQQGDGCTPEGEFYIAAKNPHSTFYLAFLISYPNIEGARRGLNSRLITKKQHDAILYAINKDGIPPQNTPLGGYIEVHGHGSGKKGNDNDGGRNWTLGCIALSNENIKEIFDIVPIKTPITIVKYGTKTIESYFN